MAKQAGINPSSVKPIAQNLMDNMRNLNEISKNIGGSSNSSKTIIKTVEQKLMLLNKVI
ncbi:MAG: hypothetical protein ACI9ES_003292 [Oceanospirillaceae bacterium]|jgi:hypothetical protein